MADVVDKDGEILDGDTVEALKELESEGHELQDNILKSKPEAPKPAEPTPPKAEDKKPVEPNKDDAANKDPKDPNKSDDPDKGKPKTDRQTRTVPVNVHNEERHKRQEAEKLAAELQAKLDGKGVDDKPKSAQTDNDIRKFATDLAEKHGLDAEFLGEFAESIVNMARKGNVLPENITKQLEKFDKISSELETQKTIQEQDQGFNAEYAEILKEFPDLKSDEVKDALKEIAFSEGYTATPLRTIAIEYMHDHPVEKGRKTIEGRDGGGSVSRDAEVIDFANLTEEQFANLTPAQMDQYDKWMENNPR